MTRAATKKTREKKQIPLCVCSQTRVSEQIRLSVTLEDLTVYVAQRADKERESVIRQLGAPVDGVKDKLGEMEKTLEGFQRTMHLVLSEVDADRERSATIAVRTNFFFLWMFYALRGEGFGRKKYCITALTGFPSHVPMLYLCHYHPHQNFCARISPLPTTSHSHHHHLSNPTPHSCPNLNRERCLSPSSRSTTRITWKLSKALGTSVKTMQDLFSKLSDELESKAGASEIEKALEGMTSKINDAANEQTRLQRLGRQLGRDQNSSAAMKRLQIELEQV